MINIDKKSTKQVGQLQQTIESEGDKHKKMISRYEEQLGKLKLEVLIKQYAILFLFWFMSSCLFFYEL